MRHTLIVARPRNICMSRATYHLQYAQRCKRRTAVEARTPAITCTHRLRHIEHERDQRPLAQRRGHRVQSQLLHIAQAMPTTPSKRRGAPGSPVRTPKRRTQSHAGSPQTSLLSFLSPKDGDKKTQVTEDEAYARQLASDTAQIEADEAMARALQEAWAEEGSMPAPGPSDAPETDTNGVPSKAHYASLVASAGTPAEDKATAADAQAEDTQCALETQSAPTYTPKAARRGVDVGQLDAGIAALDLTQDPAEFEPACIDTAHWPCDTLLHVPYALFAHGFARASGERSRITILRILTNLVRIVLHHEPSQLVAALYLMSNEIAPSYAGLELGLGGSLLQKITMQVSGRPLAFLRKTWKAHGDAGDVAFEACRGVTQLVQHEPLTIGKVVRFCANVVHYAACDCACVRRQVGKRQAEPCVWPADGCTGRGAAVYCAYAKRQPAHPRDAHDDPCCTGPCVRARVGPPGRRVPCARRDTRQASLRAASQLARPRRCATRYRHRRPR